MILALLHFDVTDRDVTLGNMFQSNETRKLDTECFVVLNIYNC